MTGRGAKEKSHRHLGVRPAERIAVAAAPPACVRGRTEFGIVSEGQEAAVDAGSFSQLALLIVINGIDNSRAIKIESDAFPSAAPNSTFADVSPLSSALCHSTTE